MNTLYNDLYEEPAYGMSEAATYLRVPYQTLRYWLTGFGRRAAIIMPVEIAPVRLSFFNLLECHVLAGMRKIYDVKVPRIRNALRRLSEESPNPHPLISETFLTDHKDLFIERLGKLVNLSQYGQMGLQFYHVHLERIAVDTNGLFRFFPFVVQPAPSEPKSIEINPTVGFGKPVITGTAISTAVIASRFIARESIAALAQEYDCTPQQIEEAIRWERALPAAA